MVNQITSQFRSIYLDEFKMDYDRDVAKMKIATSPNGVISGGTAYFDVVDPADEALEKQKLMMDGQEEQAKIISQEKIAMLRAQPPFRGNPNATQNRQ